MSLDLLIKVEQAIEDGRFSKKDEFVSGKMYIDNYVVNLERLDWDRNKQDGYKIEVLEDKKGREKFKLSYSFDKDFKRIENISSSIPIFNDLIERNKFDEIKSSYDYIKNNKTHLVLEDHKKQEAIECCIVNNNYDIANYLIKEQDFNQINLVDFIKEYDVDERFYSLLNIDSPSIFIDNEKYPTQSEMLKIQNKIEVLIEDHKNLLKISNDVNLFLRDGDLTNDINKYKISILNDLNIQKSGFNNLIKKVLLLEHQVDLDNEIFNTLIDLKRDVIFSDPFNHNIRAFALTGGLNSDKKNIEVRISKFDENGHPHDLMSDICKLSEIKDLLLDNYYREMKISKESENILSSTLKEQRVLNEYILESFEIAKEVINPTGKVFAEIQHEEVSSTLNHGSPENKELLSNQIKLELKNHHADLNHLPQKVLLEVLHNRFPREILKMAEVEHPREQINKLKHKNKEISLD